MFDAHIAPYGEAQTRFTEALSLFLAVVPKTCIEEVQAPTWEALNDRLNRIVCDHREATKVNLAASRIIEVREERMVLQNDVVQAIDEDKEGRRAKRNEHAKPDKRLMEAGKIIRNLAVQPEG